MNATGVPRNQVCEAVIHGHDGFVRHMAVRIGDQIAWNVDRPRRQMTVADVLQ
jgi:hypothetical protein